MDTPARDYRPGATVTAGDITGTALAPITGGAWFVAVNDTPTDVAIIKRPTPTNPNARIVERGDLNAPIRYAEAARAGYLTVTDQAVPDGMFVGDVPSIARAAWARTSTTFHTLHDCPVAAHDISHGGTRTEPSGASRYGAALAILQRLTQGRGDLMLPSGTMLCRCTLGEDLTVLAARVAPNGAA